MLCRQVVPQGLLLYPNISDIENVVAVSKSLGILILPISISLEGAPLSLGCKLILRRSLRQRNQVIWISRPLLWLQSCVTREILAQ